MRSKAIRYCLTRMQEAKGKKSARFWWRIVQKLHQGRSVKAVREMEKAQDIQ